MGISFDQMDGHIWFNGEFVPWADARIHVLSHGLHYASCVFEGERAYEGKIFKLREHTERLFILPGSSDLIYLTALKTLMPLVRKH